MPLGSNPGESAAKPLTDRWLDTTTNAQKQKCFYYFVASLGRKNVRSLLANLPLAFLSQKGIKLSVCERNVTII